MSNYRFPVSQKRIKPKSKKPITNFCDLTDSDSDDVCNYFKNHKVLNRIYEENRYKKAAENLREVFESYDTPSFSSTSSNEYYPMTNQNGEILPSQKHFKKRKKKRSKTVTPRSRARSFNESSSHSTKELKETSSESEKSTSGKVDTSKLSSEELDISHLSSNVDLASKSSSSKRQEIITIDSDSVSPEKSKNKIFKNRQENLSFLNFQANSEDDNKSNKEANESIDELPTQFAKFNQSDVDFLNDTKDSSVDCGKTQMDVYKKELFGTGTQYNPNETNIDLKIFKSHQSNLKKVSGYNRDIDTSEEDFSNGDDELAETSDDEFINDKTILTQYPSKTLKSTNEISQIVISPGPIKTRRQRGIINLSSSKNAKNSKKVGSRPTRKKRRVVVFEDSESE